MDTLSLDKKDEIELEVYTELAKARLKEDENTPGQRINAILAGEKTDRIPFQLFSYSAKLINKNLYDFFFDPVVRFKASCAQIIRWGEVEIQNATRINSYKIGEALGAKLKYGQNAAPATAEYVLKNEEDFSHISIPDVNSYLGKDIWSVKNIEARFGDMIGPPTTFIYPPFSWVATYMLDINQLLIALYENPSFVHEMCNFATELEIQVSNSLARETNCAFFMPDGFCELLSPKQYAEFAIPYIARLINANKNSLFYITVPKADYRQITDLYEAIKNHQKLICMGSSIKQGNPLASMEDFKHFCNLLDNLNRPFQIAIDQNMVTQASTDELEKHIREMIDIACGCKYMIRTDVIDPETSPRKVDILIDLVNKYTSF